MSLLAVSVSACAGASLVVVDGQSVYDRPWKDVQGSLPGRASFDLDCPKEQLELRLLNVAAFYKYPTEVGVTGCGKRATYVRVVGTGVIGPWSLNQLNGVKPE